ncbi:hypothetical protein [Candidatus Protochlamydia amoebophila]|nr:hypothetical protein [Candidatus Protochlamydia amoebophila]
MDLSKHVGADVMMTSQVLRTLETKGLVGDIVSHLILEHFLFPSLKKEKT